MIMARNSEYQRAHSSASGLIPAAEYVRMSTEHQQYSTDIQAAAIRSYAVSRRYEVVRSYSDQGKSGLTVEGRPGLQQLLADVEGNRPDFEAVLVYDVSRLGRFQDPDEAASHELRCRRAGVKVHYCAEQFENDGSLGSSIIKSVKRAMAGEYSRELSVKVYAGKANLIRRGFRQGGSAGLGLRRMRVDKDGTQKDVLGPGEHKCLTTDRVILIPGPASEQMIVREIFERFTERAWCETRIANDLNSRGILSDLGRPWTREAIHGLLANEKYIGNNVWGRRAYKLRANSCRTTADKWVRTDGAFAPIVDAATFQRAREIIAARATNLTDEQMLEFLRTILRQEGALSQLIIDRFEGCPRSGAYRHRFGSMAEAYALVGYRPFYDTRYVDRNRYLRQLRELIIDDVVTGVVARGGTAELDQNREMLTINREFTASVVIVRCLETKGGSVRWVLRLDAIHGADIALVVRMDAGNLEPRDYYVLPLFDVNETSVRMCERNAACFDRYRCESLEPFYRLVARTPLGRAA
jgi:DNA invertase Pin-like site-specific DNA recombinase